jgi:hypothetical protein
LLAILSRWQTAIGRVILSHWPTLYPCFWLLPYFMYNIFLHKLFFFLEMKVKHSPESAVWLYQTIWSHIPELHNLNSSRYVTPFSSGKYSTVQQWHLFFINIVNF